MSSGKIAQVISPVLRRLVFSREKLPRVNNALVVYKNDEKENKNRQQSSLRFDGMVHYCSHGIVTDGLTHWNGSIGLESSISVPVGKKLWDMSFNVWEAGSFYRRHERQPIHKKQL